MSESCRQCSGRANNGFLCSQCQTELRDMLQGLCRGQLLPSGHYAAGWLEFLQDAAEGNTRLGVSVRHSTDHTAPLPWNERASDLLQQATEMLSRWVGEINMSHETLGEQ